MNNEQWFGQFSSNSVIKSSYADVEPKSDFSNEHLSSFVVGQTSEIKQVPFLSQFFKEYNRY